MRVSFDFGLVKQHETNNNKTTNLTFFTVFAKHANLNCMLNNAIVNFV